GDGLSRTGITASGRSAGATTVRSTVTAAVTTALGASCRRLGREIGPVGRARGGMTATAAVVRTLCDVSGPSGAGWDDIVTGCITKVSGCGAGLTGRRAPTLTTS